MPRGRGTRESGGAGAGAKTGENFSGTGTGAKVFSEAGAGARTGGKNVPKKGQKSEKSEENSQIWQFFR
jgi:hypothetical protein